MKKIIAICLMVVLLVSIFAMAGCNYQAIVYLPDGTVVEGKCEGWTDFSDGDQLQVKIDGKTYLTHSENVVLIKE